MTFGKSIDGYVNSKVHVKPFLKRKLSVPKEPSKYTLKSELTLLLSERCKCQSQRRGMISLLITNPLWLKWNRIRTTKVSNWSSRAHFSTILPNRQELLDSHSSASGNTKVPFIIGYRMIIIYKLTMLNDQPLCKEPNLLETLEDSVGPLGSLWQCLTEFLIRIWSIRSIEISFNYCWYISIGFDVQ